MAFYNKIQNTPKIETNLNTHFNRLGILNELKNIPNIILAKILSDFSMAYLKYNNGEFISTDGKTWTREKMEAPLASYIQDASNSQLQDTITLEKTYVVTVLKPKNPLKSDKAQDYHYSHAFLFKANELCETNPIDDIYSQINHKQTLYSDFIFSSSALQIQLYTPFEGTTLFPLQALN